MPTPGKHTDYLMVKADGEEVQVPVATATGHGEGPTLLVVAGVHGSEYVGIEADEPALSVGRRQSTERDTRHRALPERPCLLRTLNAHQPNRQQEPWR